jgi:hypothetical protein
MNCSRKEIFIPCLYIRNGRHIWFLNWLNGAAPMHYTLHAIKCRFTFYSLRFAKESFFWISCIWNYPIFDFLYLVKLWSLRTSSCISCMHAYMHACALNQDGFVQIASCAIKISHLRYPQVGDISILFQTK